MDPVGRNSAPNDNCKRTLERDRIHWRSDPAQPGNPFHVTWTPEDCSWMEAGNLDIRGRLVRPGMHWYLPGRDAGMYYVANIFEMEGTILGRRVRGMIGFDPIYMFEGGEIYRTRDALVQEKLELVWYTWATRYKDGSIEGFSWRKFAKSPTFGALGGLIASAQTQALGFLLLAAIGSMRMFLELFFKILVPGYVPGKFRSMSGPFTRWAWQRRFFLVPYTTTWVLYVVWLARTV
jgi:hypothetical protein